MVEEETQTQEAGKAETGSDNSERIKQQELEED